MLCYRDRTFCTFWGDCAKGYKCDRALTDERAAAAGSEGLSVCQFSEKPDCHVKIKESTND